MNELALNKYIKDCTRIFEILKVLKLTAYNPPFRISNTPYMWKKKIDFLRDKKYSVLCSKMCKCKNSVIIPF